MRFAQRTTKHCEVLAIHKDQAPVNHAVARDHAVARNLLVLHAEVHTAVLDKHVPLFKTAFVQQHLQALTRGEFAFFVLRVDALLPTAYTRQLTLGFQLFKNVLHAACSVKKWISYKFNSKL